MKLGAMWLACLATAETLGAGALQFDGRHQVSLDSIPGPGLTDRMTIEAWIHYSQNGHHNRILTQWWDCHGYCFFIPWEDRDSLEIEIGGIGRMRTSANIPSSTWVHVAATYDGAFARLFLDGEEILERSVSGGIPDCPGARLAIGSDGGTHYYRGMIDEVRLWSIARTEEEIERDRFYVLRGDEEGLEGFWRFEEGEGQIAADSSVNG
ncbi:MAG: LamG domain-containing protein, partial [Planctomycetes bacterium]|nr:LamG domain-containing protein [Planctomycetota bacterium]